MSNRSKNLVDSFHEWARSVSSISKLQSFVELAPRPPLHALFRQYLIFHKGNLEDYFDEMIGDWDLEVSRVNNNAPVYKIHEEYGRDEKKVTSGVFAIFPGTERHFFRLFTISYSSFWNNAVSKLIRRLYPGAMPVFFKQDELEENLLYFESSLKNNKSIMVSDMTMKRKVSDEAYSPSGYIETDRLWSEMTVKDAFDKAKEENYWFTSIKFDVIKWNDEKDGYRKISQVRIQKDGSISYDYMHNEINEAFLDRLESNAARRLEFLGQRGRRERNYKQSKPIQIEYTKNIFSEKSEVRRFGEVIASYPKSTRAVYHSNPYYHASIADFEDGSSMDLWILSSKKVLISPQAKTSEHALQRLISHIFFEFQEGELSEYTDG